MLDHLYTINPFSGLIIAFVGLLPQCLASRFFVGCKKTNASRVIISFMMNMMMIATCQIFWMWTGCPQREILVKKYVEGTCS